MSTELRSANLQGCLVLTLGKQNTHTPPNRPKVLFFGEATVGVCPTHVSQELGPEMTPGFFATVCSETQ